MSADPVNDDERWLAAEVAAGRIADFMVRSRAGYELVEIRGEFLRSLALSASRPAGLAVRGARITGTLDLQLCQLVGPLVLRDCEFVEPLDLSKALLVDVDLSSSRMPGLQATGADIRHDLTLRSAGLTGPTKLDDVTIGGNLNLNGGNCSDSHGTAINADRARVGGGVFCRAGFHAEGEVRLIGATIGGQLALTGGTFTNPNGDAISADSVCIGGGVFCGDGFHAEGEVRLIGATIGGQLALTGGTFTNPNGDAISADGARIEGDVFCGDGFHAEGEVRLLGANVSGQLALTGGTFTNPNGVAINADRAHFNGSVACGDGFHAEGEVRLRGATIGGQLALTGGTFTNPHGDAINADRARIGTLLILSSESAGHISLVGAHAGYLTDALASWQQFSGVSLLDFTYDRIVTHGWPTQDRLLWLERDPEYRAQPYEQLAQTLRAQGHEREAREVMVAKNRRRRKQQRWYRRISEYLFDWLLAYGYHPLQRTLPTLAVLYALGALLIFPAARDHQAIIATRAAVHQPTTSSGTTTGGVATAPPTDAEQRPVIATNKCPSDYPCFSAWAFTADALIPLINTHQTDFWAVSGSKAGRWALLYSRLASALGWLLSTAAALGFTGLIRRD